MLVHGTEKGSMACLENPGTEGAAQIGDLPVSKSGKIRDGKFHSLLIINTYISGGRIPYYIVVEKNSRCAADFKVLNPGIAQGKADHKSSYIIMLQHENIIMLASLGLNINRHNFNIKSGRFCHLTKTHQDIIGKMMRFLIPHILFFYYNTDFFRRFLITPQLRITQSYGSFQNLFP